MEWLNHLPWQAQVALWLLGLIILEWIAGAFPQQPQTNKFRQLAE